MNDDISRSPNGLPASAEGQGQDNIADRLMAVFRGAFGARPNGSARAVIEEAIAADEATGGSLAPEERAMLRAILRLSDMRIDDVMVPRADIEALDADTSLAEVIATFREAGHSRMPVYRETLDDPIGMVHIRDLMIWIADSAIRAAADAANAAPRYELAAVDLSISLQQAGLVRSLLFVPPSMPARVLLQKMQATRTQMALVIDEYGGTDGLVSLEDLVEIIVGEIEDEHDLEEEPTIEKVADGVFVADARTSLDDVQSVIGPDFRIGENAEDVETIGGLIFATTGRIPVRGEIVRAVEGFELEVLDADPRRIKKIRIRDGRKRHKLRAAPSGHGGTATGEDQARLA